jgi:hypothetical protein
LTKTYLELFFILLLLYSLSAPLRVRVTPVHQKADVGAKAKFSCAVAGFPIRDVRWLRDGHQINGNGGDGGGDKVAISRDGTVNGPVCT